MPKKLIGKMTEEPTKQQIEQRPRTRNSAKWLVVATLGLSVLVYQACGVLSRDGSSSAVSMASGVNTGSSLGSNSAPIVAGEGANVPGQGALTVPTAAGVVARIQNGLQGHVSATSGNFAQALNQLRSNLPAVSDPLKASGFDQVQLLVYAACSDLTTGGMPLMKSKYGVDPNATLSSNQTALVAAGVLMMDQYVAGLATQGPVASQVAQIFTGLVGQSVTNSSSTTMAFISVCIAANTAGSTMMGF